MAEPPPPVILRRKIEEPEPEPEAQPKNRDENPKAAVVIEKKMVLQPVPALRLPEVMIPIRIGGIGQKQITLEAREEEKVSDGDDDEELPPPPLIHARGLNLNDAVLGRENFDRWIFGEVVSEEARKTQLNDRLRKKIENATRFHGFTAAQTEKLHLAGRGDMKRYFDRVEDKRREFEKARKNFQTGRVFLNQLRPLCQEFQNGPFGIDSLFAKASLKMVSEAKDKR